MKDSEGEPHRRRQPRHRGPTGPPRRPPSASTALTSGTLHIDDIRGPNATGALKIVFADPGAADGTLSISKATTGDDTTITVNLATDANGLVTSTLDDIVSALGESSELLSDGKTTIGKAVKAYTDGTATALGSAQTVSTFNETNGSSIALESKNYGSSEKVNVNVLAGTFATTADDYTTESSRDIGSDIGGDD